MPGAENKGENKETVMPELYLVGDGGKGENEQMHKQTIQRVAWMTRKKGERCRSATVLCSVWEGRTEEGAPGQGPEVHGNTSCRQVWAQRSMQRKSEGAATDLAAVRTAA